VFVVKLTRSSLSNLINSKIVCLLWELFANNLLKNFSYNFGSICLANGELDNSKQFNDTVRNASSDKLLKEDTQLMNSHSPLEDGHLELADSVSLLTFVSSFLDRLSVFSNRFNASRVVLNVFMSGRISLLVSSTRSFFSETWAFLRML